MSCGHPHHSRYARLVAAFAASAFVLLTLVTQNFSSSSANYAASIVPIVDYSK